MRPLALPLLVAASAVVVLVADVLLPARRGRLLGWASALLLAGVLGASFAIDLNGPAAYGAYRGNAWTTFFARLFLAAGILTILGAVAWVERQVARRQGEYYVLLLITLVGMMILPGARDLILLVVGFETMGIPLYVLAAYAKTDAPAVAGPARSPAAEAALKLYLVGASSTAITLFGLSLVVGMAGTTRLAGLVGAGLAPISVVGLMLVLAGMAFKIGAVPFHMWVPDTYQGAPTPFVAFLSIAPKAAGIAAVVTVFAGRPGPWWSVLAVLSAASMLVGNLLAVPQTDVRRLLGFSGVAQLGYVLLAVASHGAAGLGAAAFYLAAYLPANIGTFLVVHAVAEGGGGHDLAALAGLRRRSPWLAVALLLFLLSLAGIPFVIGFWAKLDVFLAAFRAGLVALVALGAVLAVVGLFYYLQVARAAFIVEPRTPAPLRVGRPLAVAILICLVAVVGLGLWPRPLHDAAARAGAALVEQGVLP